MDAGNLFAALSGAMVDPTAATDGLWFEFPWTGDKFRLARYSSPRAARLRDERIAKLPENATDEDRKRVDEEVFADALLLGWVLAKAPTLEYSRELGLAMLRDPRCYELATWLRNQTFSDRFRASSPAEVALGN